MSNNSNNRPGIPAWQRTNQSTTPTNTPSGDSSTPTSEPAQPEQSPVPTVEASEEASAEEHKESHESQSTELLEQAQRFLEDPTIRNAPREKKVAFLESKGVKTEEIEQLLGAPTEGNALIEIPEPAWSTTPSGPSEAPTSAQPPTPRPQPRDIPPIVTYPEFLAQTEKPPPLMTTQRLATTLYAAGGLFATMYGFSKYVLAPMSTNLADSRHDFANHTQEQLSELNKRLRDAASVDPATKVKTSVVDVVDDISEADSDPTELFHRDFGTQTTPSLSRRPSVSENPDSEPTVTAHENRLKIITSHLKELEATRSNDYASSDSLKTKLSDLSSYLTEMSYQNSYYSGMGFYGSNYGLPKTKDGKEDQIEVLKSDIRAVKGVFLSARNFPAGGRSNTPPVGRVAG